MDIFSQTALDYHATKNLANVLRLGRKNLNWTTYIEMFYKYASKFLIIPPVFDGKRMFMKSRNCLKLIISMAILLALAAPATASGVFTGVKVSTLGVGMDVGYQFTDWFKIRLNGNYLPLDFSHEIEDIEYDIETKSPTAGLLLDLHPFSGKFRISAGLYYRDFDVDLTATPHKAVDIGDYRFQASEVGKLEGNITFDKWAPYVGLGWGMGGGKHSNFSLDFDIGAMWLSGTKVTYKATGPISDPSLVGHAKYQEYVDAVDNEIKDIEDDVDKWGVYPIVSIGFSYRF